jgi:molecular chaperone GrpE
MADKKNRDSHEHEPQENAAESAEPEESADSTRPVVRDKRRVDPKTGEVRHPTEEPLAEPGPVPPAADNGDEGAATITDEELSKLLEDAQTQAVPATDHDADYKRLQAEYFNYRKRVERDRQASREVVIAEFVKSLLPILDDLDRAHAHGDLEGSPLDLVAQKLRATFEGYGLEVVGESGEAFDPHLHEAIFQKPTEGVTVNTVASVIEPGYKLGERLLRPAKVAVSVPTED